MKILFLDIDGVLVTKTHLLGLQEQGKPIADIKGHHLFDPQCIVNLKKILDITGARIVLSSSWKMFGWEVMADLWKNRNCPGLIMGFTPNLNNNRGQEISTWLKHHVGLIESFAIIDDDISDLEELMPHVIQTTWEHGLTDELVKTAIGKLRFSLC